MEPTAISSQTQHRLDALAQSVDESFKSTLRILSFEEWFELLCAHPTVHARGAAQYVRDAFDYFGRRDVHVPSGKVSRFQLFDCRFDGAPRLVGQELAQNAVYEAIDRFVRIGYVDRLILLHGPNGSSKTTLLDSMQRALEQFSTTDEGVMYRFSWIFPNKQVSGGGIGFGSLQHFTDPGHETFAKLTAEAITAKVSDENKDSPIYLIPLAQREQLLRELCKGYPNFVLCDSVLRGQLSHRNRKIFDALLNSYQGDLQKVYQHVQVERLFLSRTYRTGLVTVEPKQTVDARSYPVTGDRAFASLPSGVGDQVLYGCQGDLVDANRGVINFSDLLKRPYEHYKYLLTATESGQVALDHVMLNLDVVFTGSANDLNLLEFRALRSGEYQSLRARLELVPVPYLLDYRVERSIYKEQVGDLLRGIHIAPHVSRILALWGVMTRLRPPYTDKYHPKLKPVLQRITPLEKADLYAYGRVPSGLSSEEARELLAIVPQLSQERFPQAVVHAEGSDHLLGDYEGSFGASVRDLKRILLAAASESGTTSVTVPRMFREIRKFLTDSLNHRWMGLQATSSGYHLLDGEKSITQAAWNRWLDLSDWEVREAMGLVDEARYLELFRKYVIHVSHSIKRERLYDPVTGQLTDPDEKFMRELERTMDPQAGKTFREDVLSRIGAWALSNPDGVPDYAQIFSDYFARLREDYYRQQKTTVSRGISRILELLADERPRDSTISLSPGEENIARHALEVLLGDHDGKDDKRERHSRETLRETLVQLAKYRY